VREVRNEGITLISLVITIIVLLILTGVSIATLLGENGILKQANNTKERTNIEYEREGLFLNVINSQIDVSEKIGKELHDKNIQNGNKWHIIVVNDVSKIYGSKWHYIEKETEVESYGKTKREWLINYETGEIVNLEEGKYIELSYNIGLAVTDGLIFNIDSSIVEGVKLDELEDILGNNVELINFDGTQNSGLTSNSFNFDGVNDYIKVKYDNETQKQILAENGFTFEYYGKLNEGQSYDELGNPIELNYEGIFCYWNGDETKQAHFRFGIHHWNSLMWNAGVESIESDFSAATSELWNIKYSRSDFQSGDDVYYTITVDTSNSFEKNGKQYYMQRMYANGVKVYEGGYSKEA